MDFQLLWKSRVDSVALKIGKTIRLLSKLRDFVPYYTLANIYDSLIIPYLRYGLTVWGQASKTHLNKLLILQKCALCGTRRCKSIIMNTSPVTVLDTPGAFGI